MPILRALQRSTAHPGGVLGRRMRYNIFMKLNAQQLRDVEEKDIQDKLKAIKHNPIYFILENVYDTYNVGGLFRLADALAIRKMYLCGEMETPPNTKIKKASIGTYKVVEWEYVQSTKEAIVDLNSKLKMKNEKLSIIAVEQSPKSIPYTQAQYVYPIALIFGNETSGILPETLALANHIVEIPMWGINKSLNVIVSAAVVAYWAIRK